jgi:hypothetical protein
MTVAFTLDAFSNVYEYGMLLTLPALSGVPEPVKKLLRCTNDPGSDAA